MTDVPRIELHLHLEGAAPPDFIRRIAAEKSHRLDRVFDERGGYDFSDFTRFLQVYDAATAVLTTPDDYARLVTAICEDLAEQGVIYAETFVSPEFCGGNDLTAWRDYLAAMTEAAARAEARHGLRLRGVVTPIRHLGPERAKGAALCAAETAGAWVVGLGIGGDERVGLPADFAYSFDMAREAGLGLTAHAGEWGGPDSVRGVLDDLRVTRVGHGVRAIEDPALVDRLAEDGVVLEICPGSNIALGLYPNWKAHPIDRLRRAGVPVTVSTDDPPFFHTSLTREYDRLSDVFGWQDDTFRAINITAAQAAFCDAATRADLLTALEAKDD
ncbi:MAG: adenosine deaminase [Rhodobacteraceae bacterium]|nr:adenosine deaminase [Paracoccaceae bacterium]